MLKSARYLLFTLATVSALPGAVIADAPSPYNARSPEAPELGRAGNLTVGTSYRDLQLPKRTRLTAAGAVETERSVGVRFWYPADSVQGPTAVYRHKMMLAGKVPHETVEHGIAFEAATPARGKFPLVVVSHGFSGWSEQMSRLGEHLASRGYVVASIDHKDMPFDSLPTFLLSFGNVLIDRSLDQKQVIEKLLDPAFAKAELALGAAESGKAALIGYSMGGYGALHTAGASYDPASKPFAQLPEVAKAQTMTIDRDLSARLNALVLIAPWGGQPDNRAWTDRGLVQAKAPTLIIDGDKDDIVNFAGGVRWIYDGLKSTDRYLLIFREATHNVAGNATDLGFDPSVDAIGYARDPVWRQDRINQINQHFITAFLDLTLKGDFAKRKYLDVPTPIASDGKWPVAFGTLDGGAVAGDGQPEYWRGFHRRWANGLELHHKNAAQ